MKQTIWRFKLDPRVQHHALEMPTGARITSLCFHPDKVEFWALVDPSAPEEVRHFVVVPTGVEVDVPEDRHVHVVGMFPGETRILHLMELVQGGVQAQSDALY